jgi:hypothetical protein
MSGLTSVSLEFVIITFLYRMYSMETVDLDLSFTFHGFFMTVIQLRSNTISVTLLSAEEETSSKQVTTGQSREMMSKTENMLNAEEGISTER